MVGNPPYITVKDKRLNDAYREMYPDVCSGKYALSVPFAQRFFELAKRGDGDGRGAGLRRPDHRQLVHEARVRQEADRGATSPHEVELTQVIDTSGAYIPGHGTPTVILVGRNRRTAAEPGRSVAVLGMRGEPSAPEIPARGLRLAARSSSQVDRPGSRVEWVSVAEMPREAACTPSLEPARRRRERPAAGDRRSRPTVWSS